MKRLVMALLATAAIIAMLFLPGADTETCTYVFQHGMGNWTWAGCDPETHPENLPACVCR